MQENARACTRTHIEPGDGLRGSSKQESKWGGATSAVRSFEAGPLGGDRRPPDRGAIRAHCPGVCALPAVGHWSAEGDHGRQVASLPSSDAWWVVPVPDPRPRQESGERRIVPWVWTATASHAVIETWGRGRGSGPGGRVAWLGAPGMREGGWRGWVGDERKVWDSYSGGPRSLTRIPHCVTIEAVSLDDMRTCADCGVSIEHRGNRAVRCAPCQRTKVLEMRRGKARKLETRLCAMCGDNISHLHGNALFCDGCAYDRKLAAGRRERRSLERNQDGARIGGGRWRYRKHLVLLLVDQRGLCGICGQVLDGNDPAQWEVDEIIPSAVGGGDDQSNLQLTHGHCRHRKGDAWEGSQVAQWRKWAKWKL